MSVDISQDFLFLWLIKKQSGLRSSSSLDVRGSRLWGSEPKGKFAIWLLQKQLPRALFNALPLPETLKDVNPIGRFWPPEKMPSSWAHKSYFNCLIWNRAYSQTHSNQDPSSRSAAAHPGSGGRAFAKYLPISGVGGHDSCRGHVSHPNEEKVFSEKIQHHLPGAFFFFYFFSSTISMHKSSCWRFNRLSVPPQSGQERASAAAVLHFILV